MEAGAEKRNRQELKKITEKSVEKTLFLADVTASASKGENAGGKRKKCKILLDFSGSPG